MSIVRFIVCVLCTFGMLFLFSCSEEQHSLEELERIKMIEKRVIMSRTNMIYYKSD